MVRMILSSSGRIKVIHFIVTVNRQIDIKMLTWSLHLQVLIWYTKNDI